jgi:Lrp/AsnC family transcriptional regulator
MELDRIDRKIIASLMADATLPLVRLAEAVGLSQTPCWKRVRRLTETGIIRARVALVDPERIGLGLTVFVGIVATEQTAAWLAKFEQVVAELPEIMEAYQLAGRDDYVIRIVARDMADYDRVRDQIVSALPVREFSPSFAMKRLKCATTLPIDTRAA